ncbi:hypothetical protein [Streptomyces sp. cmx-4-9]|uniref:hypothetical protein n=1 Tax=Streptomyces sp. cmx-4-9 TaxID=2790941 RepID=UPI0039805610
MRTPETRAMRRWRSRAGVPGAVSVRSYRTYSPPGSRPASSPTGPPERRCAPMTSPRLLKPGTAWSDARQRALAVAPGAFRDDHALNLWAGSWQPGGRILPATGPVDGSAVTGPPRLDSDTPTTAVRAAGAVRG